MHVFDDMQSERKVQNLYKRLERFVSPETVKIGRHVLSNKYKTAQYISIQKAIQSLVLDLEFAEAFPAPSKGVRSNEKFTVFTRNILNTFSRKQIVQRSSELRLRNFINTFFSDLASLSNGM
jgi:hypothetical protein